MAHDPPLDISSEQNEKWVYGASNYRDGRSLNVRLFKKLARLLSLRWHVLNHKPLASENSSCLYMKTCYEAPYTRQENNDKSKGGRGEIHSSVNTDIRARTRAHTHKHTHERGRDEETAGREV
eukprot:6192077-Pleurochrysis_carterae.AAC.2